MPESIEQTKYLLADARKATVARKEELDHTIEQLDRIDSLHIGENGAYPLTDQVLNVIESNEKAMAGLRQDMRSMIDLIEKAEQHLNALEEYQGRLEAFLEHINHYASDHDYDAAFGELDRMDEALNERVLDQDLSVQSTGKEIAAWTRAALYSRMGEYRASNGEDPLSEEEMDQFKAAVDALPVGGIHQKEHVLPFIDRMRGFKALIRYRVASEHALDINNVKTTLLYLMEIRLMPAPISETSRRRLIRLRMLAADQYNRLTVDAFDVHRNYADCKELFELRGYFGYEEITHDAFKDAADEHEFHLMFTKKEAVAMKNDEFSVAVHAYAGSISSADEFEFEVLAQYASMPELGKEKEAIIASSVKKLNFEVALLLLGEGIERGMGKMLQGAICDHLAAFEKKTFHLETVAKAMVTCQERIDPSLIYPYMQLQKDLLRAPKTRKVASKSANPDVHVLYGENRENFRKPLGKPMDNPELKAWTPMRFGLSLALLVILPVVLLYCAGFAFLYFLGDKPYAPYVLVAPEFLVMILSYVAILRRFGNDERGSALYRRLLFAQALCWSAAALTYFVLPGLPLVLRQFGYTFIILAAVEGLFAFFFLKDRNKKATAFLAVPLLVIELAALGFLISDLLQGII